MATFVLIHGGGHGGWCYSRLAPLLRAEGHQVFAPTLTGCAERANFRKPGIDLDLHISDVFRLLEYEDLHDVILVGHSYGGMVMTGVADRATQRVGHLVYLDAASPKDGQSLADVAPALMDFAASSLQEVDGVELVLWPSPGFSKLFGIADEDLDWVDQRLTPHPWACFTQPLRIGDPAAVDALPRTDIVCRNELSGMQEANPNRNDGADRVWEIETGHDLMITEPEAVARMLLDVAAMPTA